MALPSLSRILVVVLGVAGGFTQRASAQGGEGAAPSVVRPNEPMPRAIELLRDRATHLEGLRLCRSADPETLRAWLLYLASTKSELTGVRVVALDLLRVADPKLVDEATYHVMLAGLEDSNTREAACRGLMLVEGVRQQDVCDRAQALLGPAVAAGRTDDAERVDYPTTQLIALLDHLTVADVSGLTDETTATLRRLSAVEDLDDATRGRCMMMVLRAASDDTEVATFATAWTSDRSPVVRRVLAEVLGFIEFSPRHAAIPAGSRLDKDTLQATGDGALRTLLEDSDSSVRKSAIEALPRRFASRMSVKTGTIWSPNPELVELLSDRVLHETDEALRAKAAAMMDSISTAVEIHNRREAGTRKG